MTDTYDFDLVSLDDDEAALFGRDTLDRLPDGPIAGEEQATRMMWALGYAIRDLERIDAAFDAEIERLEARRADVTAGLRKRIDDLRGRLADWARALRDREPRRATITLPSGTIKTRKADAEWTFPERGSKQMAELVAWCERNGFVSAVVKPPAPDPYVDKAEMKRLLTREVTGPDGKAEKAYGVTSDGERAPHVVAVPRPPHVTVDPVEVR